MNPSSHRLEHLVTQMKWRLREGQGLTFYILMSKFYRLFLYQCFLKLCKRRWITYVSLFDTRHKQALVKQSLSVSVMFDNIVSFFIALIFFLLSNKKFPFISLDKDKCFKWLRRVTNLIRSKKAKNNKMYHNSRQPLFVLLKFIMFYVLTTWSLCVRFLLKFFL